MIAAQRDTSVSALVEAFLVELTSGESKTERLKREERALRERTVDFTRRTGCHATTYTAAALKRCRISLILTGALEIKAANGFSYWDSAIIAAARAIGCRML